MRINYDTSIFPSWKVEQCAGHWGHVLKNLPTSVGSPLHTLTILTREERHQILDEWNATDAPYPHDKTVHQLFEEQVKRTPGNIALVMNEQTLSYRELNAQANQLARYIRQVYEEHTGTLLQPDTLIAICMKRSVDMVIGILAILKAGAAYVPLDPAYPEARLRFMLDDTKTSLLLTHELAMVQCNWLMKSSHTFTVLNIDTVQEALRQISLKNIHPVSTHNDLIYVIYTSGTTGLPKGVLITHQNLVNYCYWASQFFNPDSVSSFSHTQGLTIGPNDLEGASEKGSIFHSSLAFDLPITALYPPLLLGKSLYLTDWSNDQEGLSQLLLLEQGFGLLKATPSQLQFLNEKLLDNTGCFKTLMIGGEPVPSTVFKPWLYGTTKLYVHYGPTETTVGCSYYAVDPKQCEYKKILPIGRALPNTRLYVLDAILQITPIGVLGELYVGGSGVARGYLNRPELTAERFIENPFVTAEDKRNNKNLRLYKTGDLVSWMPDGTLEFIGRIDDQIKLRGYRIELGEIESVLMQNPRFRQVVVCMYQRDPDDDMSRQLILYYVPVTELALSPDQFADELRHFAREQLPEYMVPSIFIPLEQIPLTANGKIDRKALPHPAYNDGIERQTPVNLIESKMCDIWSEVLKIPSDQIYRNSDFFALGGHSIKSIQLISKIQHQFEVLLEVVNVFKHSTLHDMAEFVEKNLTAHSFSKDIFVQLHSSSHDAIVLLIHPNTGLVDCYIGFARELVTKASVVAIQYQPNLFSYSIESLSEFYVNEVIQHYPNKKYHLVGYSLGGHIAYEMAKIMEQRNLGYESLIIVDISPKNQINNEKETEENKEHNEFQVMRSLVDELGMPEQKIQQYVDSFQERKKTLDNWIDVYYTSGQVEKMAVFTTVETMNLKPNIKHDWQSHSTSKIYHDVAPGSHFTIFSLKHTSEFISIFNKYLNIETTFGLLKESENVT